MGSDISCNDQGLTPEQIQQLKRELTEYPIDPAYDEICGPDEFYDGYDPVVYGQFLAREAYETLKRSGVLPDELRRPGAPPEQTGK